MTKAGRTFKAVMTLAAVTIFMMSTGMQVKAIAEDGGAPGKDYKTYLNALAKRDGAMIRKMAEVPPGTSDEELKGQMDMMAAMTPSDQAIVSAKINKDAAVLKVTGKLEGKKQYGTIGMRKKGGVWKITSEDWSETDKK